MHFIKKFGQFPDKHRKSYYHSLPNYSGGKFQNPIHTPPFTEGANMISALREFLRNHPDTEPVSPVPFLETDLHSLPPGENVLVWFGHSSYFIQADGMKFLIDPVFSGNASPVPGSVRAFPGSNHYQAEHMPEIDLLFISHDHWDHLDYETIRKLRTRVSSVVCGLGVGQHFEYWGWEKSRITEKNWHESLSLGQGFDVTLTPARHFSGRLFSRNISLWTSYVLQTPSFRLFLGGDSGYGPHFSEIGDAFGPFDLAILECGQYNRNWRYIHSHPDELVREAQELKARRLMPVHHSKFKLSQHPWYEPLEQVTTYASAEKTTVVTPKIGEKVDLKDLDKRWETWWK